MESKTRKKLSWLIGTAVIVLVVFAAITCMVPGRNSSGPHPKLGEVVRLTGMQLPPGTKLLASSYAKSMSGDSILIAKLLLRKTDAETLIHQLPAGKTVYTERTIPAGMRDSIQQNPLYTGGEPAWWDVGKLEHFTLAAVSTRTPDRRNDLYTICGKATQNGTVIYVLYTSYPY